MLKNLKKLRAEARVSQKAVAEAIGVSQQSINKYENHNIEPDVETLVRLADYFHCTVDHLIGHEHTEKISPANLQADERALLHSYRRLSDKQKDLIHAIVESYSK